MAITFACAYLMCVLAPPVALAFADGAAALQCLSGNHHHKAAMAQPDAVEPHHHHGDGHSHAGAAHHHATQHHHEAGYDAGHDGSDGNAAPASCCGLFCVSAMPADRVPVVVPVRGALTSIVASDEAFAGRGPVRIDRPPNLLLQ
jgi:hypothetical protein